MHENKLIIITVTVAPTIILVIMINNRASSVRQPAGLRLRHGVGSRSPRPRPPPAGRVRGWAARVRPDSRGLRALLSQVRSSLAF